MSKIKSVIFDFDGVIADSYDSTIEFLQKTLSHFNLNTPTREEIIPYLGKKSTEALRIFAKDKNDVEIEKMIEYLIVQANESAKKVILMPKILNFLNTYDKKYKFAIVSNRGTNSLNYILEKHNIKNKFSVILTRDDTKRHKPDPYPLLLAVEKLNLNIDNVVYIGDTDVDFQTAESAEVEFILYNKLNLFSDLNVKYKIKSFDDLEKLLNKL